MKAEFDLHISVIDRKVEQKMGDTSFSEMDDELAMTLMKIVQSTKKRMSDAVEKFYAAKEMGTADGTGTDNVTDQPGEQSEAEEVS